MTAAGYRTIGVILIYGKQSEGFENSLTPVALRETNQQFPSNGP